MSDELNLNLGTNTSSMNNALGTAVLNGLGKYASNLPLMDMFFPHVKANEINEKNYELQQGQFEYEKALQQKIFDREDTAVQRRLNDVTKAGFSPLAALGQSAGAGQVVSTTAPQRQYTMPDTTLMRALGGAGLQMLSLQNELENGVANRELIQEQARSLGIDNEIKQHNFDYYSSRGMPTNMTGVERLIVDIAKTLGIDTSKILSGETAGQVIKTVGNGTPLEQVDNIVSKKLDEKIPQREQNRKMLGQYNDLTNNGKNLPSEEFVYSVKNEMPLAVPMLKHMLTTDFNNWYNRPAKRKQAQYLLSILEN